KLGELSLTRARTRQSPASKPEMRKAYAESPDCVAARISKESSARSSCKSETSDALSSYSASRPHDDISNLSSLRCTCIGMINQISHRIFFRHPKDLRALGRRSEPGHRHGKPACLDFYAPGILASLLTGTSPVGYVEVRWLREDRWGGSSPAVTDSEVVEFLLVRHAPTKVDLHP